MQIEEISASQRDVKPVIKFLIGAIVVSAILLDLRRPITRFLLPKYGNHPETVMAGSIRPHGSSLITAQFPGEVTSIQVSLGQKVNVGDPLLMLKNQDFELEFDRARVRLDDVRARIAAKNKQSVTAAAGDVELISAVSASSAAAQRLADFSLDQPTSSYQHAVERVKQLEVLVRQQLATDAELQQAKAAEALELRNLGVEKEHFSRLKEEDGTARARLEALQNSRTRVEGSEVNLTAELREAAEAFRIAGQRRDSQKVVSTVSGTVLKTSVSAGDVIPSGATLVQLGQLDTLDIDVPVTAALAQTLKVGQRVKVRLPTEPPLESVKPLSAVVFIPAAEQSAYTARITMQNPSPSIILVGLTAEVEFTHSEDSWRASR